MRLCIGIAVLMVTIAITAHGQAAPSCARPGDTVKVFDTERREPFSGVLTTIPPNPALLPLVPGLLNGTLEVREKLIYYRHENVIRLTTFVIDVNAPFPTSADDLQSPATTIVEKATLVVKRILTSCSPLPSVMWVGTMEQNFPQPGDTVYPGGWGVDITGATFAFSTGYTTNEDPNPPGSTSCAAGLFNVTESVAGVGVAWAPCAVGTLSFGHGHGNNGND
jgi:hypothetical protein